MTATLELCYSTLLDVTRYPIERFGKRERWKPNG